jgi:hypothetical protein
MRSSLVGKSTTRMAFPFFSLSLDACGFALASKGHDTRAIQGYLGSTRCATTNCPTHQEARLHPLARSLCNMESVIGQLYPVGEACYP